MEFIGFLLKKVKVTKMQEINNYLHMKIGTRGHSFSNYVIEMAGQYVFLLSQMTQLKFYAAITRTQRPELHAFLNVTSYYIYVSKATDRRPYLNFGCMQFAMQTRHFTWFQTILCITMVHWFLMSFLPISSSSRSDIWIHESLNSAENS